MHDYNSIFVTAWLLPLEDMRTLQLDLELSVKTVREMKIEDMIKLRRF